MQSDKPPAESNLLILAQIKQIASSAMYAAEGANLEQVLQRIAEVARELLNAQYAALGVPDGKGGLRYFKVAGMTPEAIAHVEHPPKGRGLIGAIIQDRKTIRLVHMSDDSRSVGFCRAHPHMTSLLGTPVQTGDQLFGTLYLSDRMDGQPFSEQDEWLVEVLAGYAALAIAGKQLSDQQKRLSVMEERERIAMDLHDGVIQSLYGIGMHLDLVQQVNEQTIPEAQTLINSLNAAIDDIRNYIMDLRSAAKQPKTCFDYFADVLKRLYVPNTVHIILDAPHDPPRVCDEILDAACSMVTEAVSNALRHAEAKTIRIQADYRGNLFQVSVADDGKGFQWPIELTTSKRRGGLGLNNLQQRAASYGGQLKVDSQAGHGTRLTILLPIVIREVSR